MALMKRANDLPKPNKLIIGSMRLVTRISFIFALYGLSVIGDKDHCFFEKIIFLKILPFYFFRLFTGSKKKRILNFLSLRFLGQEINNSDTQAKSQGKTLTWFHNKIDNSCCLI